LHVFADSSIVLSKPFPVPHRKVNTLFPQFYGPCSPLDLLLPLPCAVELIYADGSWDRWCFSYSVSICPSVFPCYGNTFSSTRCL